MTPDTAKCPLRGKVSWLRATALGNACLEGKVRWPVPGHLSSGDWLVFYFHEMLLVTDFLFPSDVVAIDQPELLQMGQTATLLGLKTGFTSDSLLVQGVLFRDAVVE